MLDRSPNRTSCHSRQTLPEREGAGSYLSEFKDFTGKLLRLKILPKFIAIGGKELLPRQAFTAGVPKKSACVFRPSARFPGARSADRYAV
jgi:hypothetical protein